MNKFYKNLLLILLCSSCTLVFAQQKKPVADSLHTDSLHEVTERQLLQQQQEQQIDSLIKLRLQKELELSTGNDKRTKELEDKLQKIAVKDSIRNDAQLKRIETLKKVAKGSAVVPFGDTLFFIYNKIGSFDASDRAEAVTKRIRGLYADPFFKKELLKISETETGFDILYADEKLIFSITTLDALWVNKEKKELANDYLRKIVSAISKEKELNSLSSWLKRLALVAVIILGLTLLVYFINRLFKKSRVFLNKRKSEYFRGVVIRKLEILSPEKHFTFALQANNIIRVIVIILAVYLSLPLLFSVFPETKKWTDTLLGWILTPAKSALNGVLDFLPDLFTILVIYFIFRYVIKTIRYFSDEIGRENIHLNGFHPEWAEPTFSILRVFLYAFMFVLIFPYLPGSGSDAFKGVSVFIGVLFSFGSSSAISNMVAGMVITYMRPFKVGQRVKIGDVVGDVIEKTMLVTRIRTIKNEEITVPNATVLNNNTINYSANAQQEDTGLILHTTVTIGYDVPWKKMHEALILAAKRTSFLLHSPEPFVLQTGLDDFYVSYQINAYTREPAKQATIYSELHQHIQDCCNEAGIEIMSPHYRAMRDGNASTIPQRETGNPET